MDFRLLLGSLWHLWFQLLLLPLDLAAPSFAFCFLWPRSRGFMLGFCRNPGYATSFSAVFSAFSLVFFLFFFFVLFLFALLSFFSISFFVCFFPNWASCPLVCLAVWPFVHSFFCGNPSKVPSIYILYVGENHVL